MCIIIGQTAFFGIRARINPMGKPPITPIAFLAAKLGMCTSIFLLGWKASFQGPNLPLFAAIPYVALLCGGTLLFVSSFARLGRSLRIGLPAEETTLVVSGAYRWSRNPIYLALFCLFGASLLYAFSWLNLVAVLCAVVFHHRIVLAEEVFLRRRFKDYETYCEKVPRYF